MAQKIRIIILLSENTQISIAPHFQTEWKCPRPTKPIMFYFGSAEALQKMQKNPKSFLTNIVVGNLRIPEPGSLGKDACQTIIDIHVIRS